MPEAALKGMKKVVAEIVEDMHRSGESVPEPIAREKFIATNLWFGFRRKFIENLLFRQQSLVSV
jgi:hypothetical protein